MKKMELSEFAYKCILFLLIIDAAIYNTTVNEVFKDSLHSCCLVVTIAFSILCILVRRYSIKELLAHVSILLLAVMSYIISGNTDMFASILLVVLAWKLNIDDILKMIFSIRFVVFISVVLLSLVGVLKKGSIALTSADKGVLFGYGHANTFAGSAGILIFLMFAICRNNLKKIHFVIAVIADLLIFYFSRARTSLLLMTALVFILLMCKYVKNMDKVILKVAKYFQSILLIIIFGLIFLRAKAFYEEELNFGIRIFGIPIYDSRKEHWSVFGEHKEKDRKKHKKRSDSKKKQKNKKNNKKRVEKKKSTYPSEDEDVFNLTWDEKEERTKTSTTRKMYERSEDKISESKIDKTTDKEKEFFGKRIVNFLKKCYNRCKNFITKIRKITNKMEMIGDLLEDEDIIDAVKRIKRYGVNGVKLLLPQKLNAKIIFGFEDPYYTGKVLGWTAALIPIYGDHINITPDFEKRILKGELKIKGRIRRYKILYLLWKVYKDKDELIKQKDRAIRMIGGS